MHQARMLFAASMLLLGSSAAFGAAPAQDSHSYHLPRLAPPKDSAPAAELHVPKGSRIEEYRANGQVYMVKVIPPKPFPPYYLVNKNGSGQFSRVPSTDAERMSVPQWILLRW